MEGEGVLIAVEKQSDLSSRNIRVAITRKKGGCDKSGSSARNERSEVGGESRNRYIGRLKGKKRDAADPG